MRIRLRRTKSFLFEVGHSAVVIFPQAQFLRFDFLQAQSES